MTLNYYMDTTPQLEKIEQMHGVVLLFTLNHQSYVKKGLT